MKHSMKFFIAILVISIHFGCDETNQSSHDIVMIDLTDSTMVEFNASKFLDRYKLESDPWQAISLTLRPVLDVDYVPRQTFILEPGNSLTDALVLREQVLVDFAREVEVYDISFTRPINGSSILIPLIDEIKASVNRPAHASSSTIHMVSDVLENSWMSLYCDSTQHILLNQPEIIREQFAQRSSGIENHAPNLTVRFVHVSTPDKMKIYRAMIDDVIRPVLEDVGIRVLVEGQI